MRRCNLPLVSIHIAAYNHEKYVQETIQSIIDQDYPRIELIVTDDGSRDDTWAKIDEMRSACEKRFERVVMRTRPNKGCNVTCQENEHLAQGEIIGGIASDDRYLPKAIANLVRPMLDDTSVGFTVGTNVIIDGEGRRCYWDAKRNNVYDPEVAVYRDFDSFASAYSGVDFKSSDFGTYKTLVRCNYIPNGSLRRRSLTFRSGGDGILLEDWWLHLQLSKITRYRYVPVETFAYRWHGANTMCQKERIGRMGLATQLRELEMLRREMPESSFAALFKECLPLCETICGLRFGTHYPHVERRHYWDHTQYYAVASHWSLPVTM